MARREGANELSEILAGPVATSDPLLLHAVPGTGRPHQGIQV